MPRAAIRQVHTQALLDRLGISPLMRDPTSFTAAKIRLLTSAAIAHVLSPTAYRLLILLADRIRPVQGYFFPRTETLAAELGVTVQAVRKASRQLEGAGLIHVDRCSSPYRTNRYFLGLGQHSPAVRETTVSPTLIGVNTGETDVSGLTADERAFIAAAENLEA